MLVRLEPGHHFPDEPFACFDARLPLDVDWPTAGFPQIVGEPKEGERRRLDRRSALPMQQVAVEAQQRCLFGRDPQAERCEPLFHFLTEAHRIRVVLERRYKVIGEARQFRVAAAGLLEPSFDDYLNHFRKSRSKRDILLVWW